MSIFDDYLKALVDNTPKDKREVYCLRMLFQFIYRNSDAEMPHGFQERLACIAYTIGSMAARGNCANRELHLMAWLSGASEQDINEVFDGWESGN
jgi:hypothetical protein